MSRAKHKATKLMPGASHEEQRYLAQYGDAYGKNPSACQLADRWRLLLFCLDMSGFVVGPDSKELNVAATLANGAGKKLGNEKELLSELGSQTDLLIGLIRKAIEEGNGEFFRDFADAVERIKDPADPLRKHLLQYDCYKTSLPRPTVGVITKGLVKFGFKHDNRHILRVASELGIRFSKAKRGRPKRT